MFFRFYKNVLKVFIKTYTLFFFKNTFYIRSAFIKILQNICLISNGSCINLIPVSGVGETNNRRFGQN